MSAPPAWPMTVRAHLQQLEALARSELAMLQREADRGKAAPLCGLDQASVAWDLGLDARAIGALKTEKDAGG